MSEGLSYTPPEAEAFRAAPEQEQAQIAEQNEVANFLSLRDSLGINSELADIFENSYKYADQITIPGQSPEQAAETLRHVNEGLKVIDAALEFYGQVKKNQGGHEAAPEEARLELDGVLASYPGFSNPESRQLDVERLAQIADWANQAGPIIGSAIGREVSGEAVVDVSHLNEVLQSVNRFR